MSIEITGSLNFKQNAVEDFLFEVFSADPTSPYDGQIYRNSATGRVRRYSATDTAWEDMEYSPQVIRADDYASLPTTGAADTLYVTSDTKLMYEWRNSAWVLLTGGLIFRDSKTDIGPGLYRIDHLTTDDFVLPAATGSGVRYRFVVDDMGSRPARPDDTNGPATITRTHDLAAGTATEILATGVKLPAAFIHKFGMQGLVTGSFGRTGYIILVNDVTGVKHGNRCFTSSGVMYATLNFQPDPAVTYTLLGARFLTSSTYTVEYCGNGENTFNPSQSEGPIITLKLGSDIRYRLLTDGSDTVDDKAFKEIRSNQTFEITDSAAGNWSSNKDVGLDILPNQSADYGPGVYQIDNTSYDRFYLPAATGSGARYVINKAAETYADITSYVVLSTLDNPQTRIISAATNSGQTLVDTTKITPGYLRKFTIDVDHGSGAGVIKFRFHDSDYNFSVDTVAGLHEYDLPHGKCPTDFGLRMFIYAKTGTVTVGLASGPRGLVSPINIDYTERAKMELKIVDSLTPHAPYDEGIYICPAHYEAGERFTSNRTNQDIPTNTGITTYIDHSPGVWNVSKPDEDNFVVDHTYGALYYKGIHVGFKPAIAPVLEYNNNPQYVGMDSKLVSYALTTANITVRSLSNEYDVQPTSAGEQHTAPSIRRSVAPPVQTVNSSKVRNGTIYVISTDGGGMLELHDIYNNVSVSITENTRVYTPTDDHFVYVGKTTFETKLVRNRTTVEDITGGPLPLAGEPLSLLSLAGNIIVMALVDTVTPANTGVWFYNIDTATWLQKSTDETQCQDWVTNTSDGNVTEISYGGGANHAEGMVASLSDDRMTLSVRSIFDPLLDGEDIYTNVGTDIIYGVALYKNFVFWTRAGQTYGYCIHAKNTKLFTFGIGIHLAVGGYNNCLVARDFDGEIRNATLSVLTGTKYLHNPSRADRKFFGTISNVALVDTIDEYEEEFTAAAVWTINHNLGFYPSIVIMDASGNVMLSPTQHTSKNTTVITHSSPLTGSVSCR